MTSMERVIGWTARLAAAGRRDNARKELGAWLVIIDDVPGTGDVLPLRKTRGRQG